MRDAERCLKLLVDQVRGQMGVAIAKEEAIRLLQSAADGEGLPLVMSCVYKNRKAFLEARRDNHAEVSVEIPEPKAAGEWVAHSDKVVLTATRKTWREVNVQYNSQPSLSSIACVEKALDFFTRHESFAGSRCRSGFLFLYEVCVPWEDKTRREDGDGGGK